jgi:hypothetical protein
MARGVTGPPGPVGDTVRMDKLGAPTLRWLRAYQGHTTNVYAATRLPGAAQPTVLTCLAPELPATALDTGSAPPPGAVVFYRVGPRNGCGEDPPPLTGVPCPTLGADTDADLVPDLLDNCALAPNAGQADADQDFLGDACDADADGDGVDDDQDCAPFARGVSAPAGSAGDTLRMDKVGGTMLRWQRGLQGHTTNVYAATRLSGAARPTALTCLAPELPDTAFETGAPPPPGAVIFYRVGPRNACGESLPPLAQEPCDTLGHDSDGDLVLDLLDNCPLASNASQSDLDQDFVGDACDGD